MSITAHCGLVRLTIPLEIAQAQEPPIQDQAQLTLAEANQVLEACHQAKRFLIPQP